MFTSGGREWDKLYSSEDDGSESNDDQLWLLAAFFFSWISSMLSSPKLNYFFLG
jgi:hypothetical protein